MTHDMPVRLLPPIDPRTVSFAVLVESMSRRPALLRVVISPVSCTFSTWNDHGGPSRDVVTHPRLEEESDAAMLSRLIPVCMARLLVISAVPSDWNELSNLAGLFDQSPLLGAAMVLGGDVAVRGDVWTALGGFEACSGSLNDACKALFERISALGFAVPGRAAREADMALCPGDSIYTAISNCYDTLKPQPRSFAAKTRQVAFLDRETAEFHGEHRRGWEVTVRDAHAAEPRRAARYWKANAHVALPEARVSLWVDASIAIVAPMNLQRLAGLFLKDHDICVFNHHARSSIAQEADACKMLGLDEPRLIDDQLAGYYADGFPDAQLAELPVILRRHTPAVQGLNEAWWSEIAAGSHRDQLSFNYVAWKTGVRYESFPMTLAVRNGLFVKFRRGSAEGERERGTP